MDQGVSTMRRSDSLLVVVGLWVLLAGCSGAGTSRPKTIPPPDLRAELAHELFFGSSSTAPATVNVRVLNRASVPIAVRKIEIDSPGMGQWGLIRTTRYFNETVDPGTEEAISLVVTAVTSVYRPTEPLQIRAIVEFEAAGTRWREILLMRP
jgi:hypothetical protein